MTHGHPIWFLLLCACLLWYSTITVYVSIKGVIDIKDMLRRLKDGEQQRESSKHEPKA